MGCLWPFYKGVFCLLEPVVRRRAVEEFTVSQKKGKRSGKKRREKRKRKKRKKKNNSLGSKVMKSWESRKVLPTACVTRTQESSQRQWYELTYLCLGTWLFSLSRCPMQTLPQRISGLASQNLFTGHFRHSG